MKLTRCVFVLALAGCAVSPSDGGLDDIPQHPTSAVCSGGRLKCFAIMQTDTVGISPHASGSSGFGPSDLASAYKLDTSLSPGATIAIVDAYGYSNLESDLATYRSQYGLPACTIANGCLKIVNQSGQTSPLPSDPPANDDWTVETALDVDMASAACPKCKILVVQADDDQGDGLFIANNAAASLGATVISNSWGGPESAVDAASAGDVLHARRASRSSSSSGDNGYNDGGQGPDYPATSAHVIAVGGTTLTKSSDARGWTETAWSGGGSACSTIDREAVRSRPAPRAAKRMTSDVVRGRRSEHRRRGLQRRAAGASSAARARRRRSSPAIFALTEQRRRDRAVRHTRTRPRSTTSRSGTNGTCGNVALQGRHRLGRPDRHRHAERAPRSRRRQRHAAAAAARSP